MHEMVDGSGLDFGLQEEEEDGEIHQGVVLIVRGYLCFHMLRIMHSCFLTLARLMRASRASSGGAHLLVEGRLDQLAKVLEENKTLAQINPREQ